MIAHFFYKHCWPSPSEIGSSPTGCKERYLCLEPKRFLWGAQPFLFSQRYPLGFFHSSDSQFFSSGDNLCQPSLKVPFAYERVQSRYRLLEFIETDRLDEVRVRAGAHSLLYVARIAYG